MWEIFWDPGVFAWATAVFEKDIFDDLLKLQGEGNYQHIGKSVHIYVCVYVSADVRRWNICAHVTACLRQEDNDSQMMSGRNHYNSIMCTIVLFFDIL